MEKYVPFEVVLLLGTSFGVTQLVKQMISVMVGRIVKLYL